jgi:hypothetical protein
MEWKAERKGATELPWPSVPPDPHLSYRPDREQGRIAEGKPVKGLRRPPSLAGRSGVHGLAIAGTSRVRSSHRPDEQVCAERAELTECDADEAAYTQTLAGRASALTRRKKAFQPVMRFFRKDTRVPL